MIGDWLFVIVFSNPQSRIANRQPLLIPERYDGLRLIPGEEHVHPARLRLKADKKLFRSLRIMPRGDSYPQNVFHFFVDNAPLPNLTVENNGPVRWRWDGEQRIPAFGQTMTGYHGVVTQRNSCGSIGTGAPNFVERHDLTENDAASFQGLTVFYFNRQTVLTDFSDGRRASGNDEAVQEEKSQPEDGQHQDNSR